MIALTPFRQADFAKFISWIDNKELLLTIAGTDFTFPLTSDQLQHYLDNKKSHSFNVIDTSRNVIIGHAEILLYNGNSCKIDKLIIGDKSNRGKGIGKEIMKELLRYAFEEIGVAIVELNVFDWNIGGIRCYESVGFKFNAEKRQVFEIDDNSWIALNMLVEKNDWHSSGKRIAL